MTKEEQEEDVVDSESSMHSKLAEMTALSKCSTYRTKAVFIPCFMGSKMMALTNALERGRGI